MKKANEKTWITPIKLLAKTGRIAEKESKLKEQKKRGFIEVMKPGKQEQSVEGKRSSSITEITTESTTGNKDKGDIKTEWKDKT
eukprot:TRINITY_DN9718_c0_g1_i1.p2 TRINITY_DN9718_c0_g1~~TRINITY_DN9718_c0_g1_i1.p2  ORF type:complete len:84 (-),score=22.11 TRINITY_DN9718_c0_g1_i1:20-271(-)